MLLRHAKAVQPTRGDDFARDLQEKGEADAARLGAYLADIDCVPDLAIVSAAARTRRTFEIVQASAGHTIAGRFERDLYNATLPQLRGLVRGTDPDVSRLMIVGHNPGIADAAVAFARDGDVTELARMRNRYPPCGLAILAFDTDAWRDASAARLDLLAYPEDLAPPS